MTKYQSLPLFPITSERFLVNAICETPAGEHNKYDLDFETGCLCLDRPIHSALTFPTNYGCLPQTLSEDGDPLDAIILAGFPLLPGAVAKCRIVGVMLMKDEKGLDPKILCVVANDPRVKEIILRHAVPEMFLKEIEHFFVHIKDIEQGKWAEVAGFEDEHKALEIVLTSQSRYMGTAP